MELKKFEQSYSIRSYECDKNGQLRLITLMNIFQDMADTHANLMGLGYDFCKEKGLAWVGSNYKIQIERMPKWHEIITVYTWPCIEKKLGAVRDFEIKDASGKTIIRAASQWILINFAKKRPVALRENLPEYQVLGERTIDEDFIKIEDLEEITDENTFNVRFDDIDLNKHVNNALYPLWASEAVDNGFRETHRPQEVEIAFKKEGLFGEKIKVETQKSANISRHSIKSMTDDRELAKVQIKWISL